MKSVISIIGLPIFRGQTLTGVKHAELFSKLRF